MVQVTVNLDDETFERLSKERKDTGISISKLVLLRLKGKEIVDKNRA